MNGKRIATLFHGTLAPGSYAFSLAQIPAGKYIVRAKYAGTTVTRPVMLR